MTTYILTDKQQYKQYRQAFRQLARAKLITAEDHILYNLVRGKDLKFGFTPITREAKLNAHYSKDGFRAFNAALASLKHNIKSRARMKEWYIKHGTTHDVQAPLCMRYGETISEEMWDAFEVALGEYK